MEVMRIDHFTIRTNDLEATRSFYEAALGLSIGWGPDFPIPTIPYRKRIVPELNELQIFVVDPNEITIEVIFASSEVDQRP